MRHRNTIKIIDRDASHRKALITNLAKSLLVHESIKTTETKAKAVKPFVEKIITYGKSNSLHTRRELIRIVGTNQIADKVLNTLAPKYKDRKGGYTRIIRLGQRVGDGAKIVLLKFV